MHNSYFLLRQLGFRLNHMLQGALVHSCYSQEKDELVIQFIGNQKEFYLHVVMRAELSMIRVPKTLNRARKNSISLFQEISGTRVSHVFCFENERCLFIDLTSNWSLLIKLFGNQSNVVLCNNRKPYELFKKKLTGDFNLSISKLDRKFDISRQQLETLNGDFQKMLPPLGGVVKKYIEQCGYYLMTMDEKWSLVQKVLSDLDNPRFYIHLVDGLPVLTLFQQKELAGESDVIEILNKFFIESVRTKKLADSKKQLFRILKNRLKRMDSNFIKSKKRLEQINTKTGFKEMADIVMAHLHLIPSGSSEVELPDFNTGKLIKIKLKPTLTPQKNAEQYYRKSKNQGKEIKVLEQYLTTTSNELNNLEGHIKYIQQCNDPRALSKYAKEYNLIPTEHVKEIKNMFKQFNFRNFKILIGKNAANNDLLTQKFTHKDDLWLHAKDVKGSHVVIKHQTGKPFPAIVIEKAAQLAAFYSKRKNDTLCPVMYTPKKYVRKPKGALPGQVVVEREKVLLVTPKASLFSN